MDSYINVNTIYDLRTHLWYQSPLFSTRLVIILQFYGGIFLHKIINKISRRSFSRKYFKLSRNVLPILNGIFHDSALFCNPNFHEFFFREWFSFSTYLKIEPRPSEEFIKSGPIGEDLGIRDARTPESKDN